MFFCMPVMSMAQEIINPICDTVVAQTAVQILQIEGYLKREEAKDGDFEAKVIGFKKIGATPLGYGATEVDPDDILYQIIEYIKIKSEKNIIYEAIVVDEISSLECGMTASPLIILTFPEYKIVGTWESYLQYKERSKQNQKEKYPSPTPNLIK
jgi:hypothetical protein